MIVVDPDRRAPSGRRQHERPLPRLPPLRDFCLDTHGTALRPHSLASPPPGRPRERQAPPLRAPPTPARLSGMLWRRAAAVNRRTPGQINTNGASRRRPDGLRRVPRDPWSTCAAADISFTLLTGTRQEPVMLISVCICSIRPGTLVETVESIMAQTFSTWELIVVGQGDDLALKALGTELERKDDRIRYLHLDRRGLANARNAAARAARGPILAFTDDDCIADPAWLQIFAEYFASDPEVGLVGGAVIAPPPKRGGPSRCPAIRPKEALYKPAPGRKAPPGWDFMGANFAVRVKAFEEVHGFDEWLGAGTEFPAGEDTDFKLRLEQAGVAMQTTPRSIVTHEHGRRYGIRALLQHSRNYAVGNGALAGKLTLLSDARGKQWVRETRSEWFDPRRPHLIPIKLLRYRHFVTAYHRCISSYEVDMSLGLLKRKVLSTTCPL